MTIAEILLTAVFAEKKFPRPNYFCELGLRIFFSRRRGHPPQPQGGNTKSQVPKSQEQERATDEHGRNTDTDISVSSVSFRGHA
jgi:hypothetical protein